MIVNIDVYHIVLWFLQKRVALDSIDICEARVGSIFSFKYNE